jgi:hypothetical protein
VRTDDETEVGAPADTASKTSLLAAKGGRLIAHNRQFSDDVTESVKNHCMDQLMPLPQN